MTFSKTVWFWHMWRLTIWVMIDYYSVVNRVINNSYVLVIKFWKEFWKDIIILSQSSSSKQEECSKTMGKRTCTLPRDVKNVAFREGVNPVSANSDQHEISPNNIHTMSREKDLRIKEMISTEKMLWSFIKFPQFIL